MEPGQLPAEQAVEARIAHLESDVAHLRSDVGEIKVDVRGVRDKMDALGTRLDTKIDGLRSAMDSKIGGLDDKIDGLRSAMDSKLDGLRVEMAKVKDSIASANVRALTLYVALAAAMLGTMARGFGWL